MAGKRETIDVHNEPQMTTQQFESLKPNEKTQQQLTRLNIKLNFQIDP